MTTESLSSYAELLDLLDHLPVLVREKRRREGLSIRRAAEQNDVSFSTLDRVEKGAECSLAVAKSLLAWVGAS